MKGESPLPDEERGGVPKIPSAAGFSWPGGTVWPADAPAASDCFTAAGVRADAGSSGIFDGICLFELAIAPTQGRQGQTRFPRKSCSCEFKGKRQFCLAPPKESYHLSKRDCYREPFLQQVNHHCARNLWLRYQFRECVSPSVMYAQCIGLKVDTKACTFAVL